MLADKYNLYYAIGLSSNSILKQKVSRAVRAVEHLYGNHGIKHQDFFSFNYAAKSWYEEQTCHAKVESTGKDILKNLSRKIKIHFSSKWIS